MSIAIELDNVSKWFTLYHQQSRTLQEQILGILSLGRQQRKYQEQFWALKDVSFQIKRGQTVGLVGSNGSGKSTALKLIARILEPTTGSITVNGRVSALLELGAGFHHDLTGRENVYLNGSLMGLGRKEMARAFDQIVAFSELEQFIDMPVKHYSSGMYTRLAFSVAIHVQPEILLVDEVLAVGDANFQRKCMERIGQLRRSGVTIVMVTHDLETVARLCHKAIWLDHGVIHEIGPGREVINKYIAHVNQQQQAQLAADHALLEAPQQAEIQAQARPATVETAMNGSKPPGGQTAPDAQITAIEVLDGTGRLATSVETGDAMTIRIHFQAHRTIEAPVFGLALYRDDEVHITGPNTQVAEYTIERIDGPGYIDYIVDEVPLTAGRFFISAGVFDETCSHCYHYAHQVHSFLVQPCSVWDQLGVVKLPAQWRINAAPLAHEGGTQRHLPSDLVVQQRMS